ncbi:hypothetical protein ACVME8_005015 [Bradyrhizobium diazoefficiens]
MKMGEETFVGFGNHRGRSGRRRLGVVRGLRDLRALCFLRRLRADSLYVERHFHFAGMLERQRHRYLVADTKWSIEADEHQVSAAGGKFNDLSGGDDEPVDERAHGHDAVVDGHFVDFGSKRMGGRCGLQPLRRVAPVLDRQIAAGDLGSPGRRPAPGPGDDEIAAGRVGGEGGRPDKACQGDRAGKCALG